MSYKVTGIHIYPIKSLGGISLSSCKALKEGFEYDRRYMLVDKDGRFLSQRENAQMALFSCAIAGDELLITYGSETQKLNLSQQLDKSKTVQVWKAELEANEVDESLSEWFSDHLGLQASLVKMTDISHRTKNFVKPPFKTQVSLADGYPYLILGEESMRELNARMETALTIDRFRANIIVDGTQAHEEDTWTKLSLGTAEFKVVSPCARCIMTTIDQQTAAKGKEPLRTLSQYRKKMNKIYFGANTIVLKEGQVKLGDTISF